MKKTSQTFIKKKSLWDIKGENNRLKSKFEMLVYSLKY